MNLAIQHRDGDTHPAAADASGPLAILIISGFRLGVMGGLRAMACQSNALRVQHSADDRVDLRLQLPGETNRFLAE